MAANQRRVALITGATSGIGAAFADRFARQGYDLIITGRQREKIQAVADVIVAQHGVAVEVVLADLARDDDLAMLCERIRSIPGGMQTRSRLEVLVNNAGFGHGGKRFDVLDIAAHEAMLKVHALATLRLTYAALPTMIANNRGSIINVSSVAGFFPLPGHTMYAATKAFVKSFSESLGLELHGTGVRVQALCPGMTRTYFHERIGLDPKKYYQDSGPLKAMTAEQVVDASLRCLERGEVICVPGLNNRLLSALSRLLPQWVIHKALTSVRDF
jgi:short-subunit dehydrogenase